MVGKVGNSLLSLLAITILIFAACEARNEWFLAENCWINSSFVVNSVRHSTQEHSENGLLHHLLYAPSLLNLMSKNIFKNIFVLVHTFVLDLWSFSSLRPFGGGSNLTGDFAGKIKVQQRLVAGWPNGGRLQVKRSNCPSIGTLKPIL